MLKSELAFRISTQLRSLSLKEIELAINQIIACMSVTLGHGDCIEIRQFGRFSLQYRSARRAHNPKTGAHVFTEEMYMARFRSGKKLRERVNDSRLKMPILASDDCSTES